MSNSRPFIIQILEEAFKDPTKAKELRDATIETLKERPGSASRIFDKFPCLLPTEMIQDISKKCLTILSNMEVSSITYDPNGIHVHNTKDQENISLFVKEIASLAIKELLDKNGHIEMELVKLLGWESLKDKLVRSELTIAILCGYVGAINQEIALRFSDEILALNPAYTGFTGYLNKKVQNQDFLETNVRQWVIYKLNDAGYVFNVLQNKDNKIDANNLLICPNKPSTADSLMVLSAINKASDITLFKKKSYHNPYLNIGNMKRNSLIQK